MMLNPTSERSLLLPRQWGHKGAKGARPPLAATRNNSPNCLGIEPFPNPPGSSDAPVEIVRNRQANQPYRQIVETAARDRALPNPAGKPQSVPEGRDKLKVIDLSAVALEKVEAEARETDKALKKILEKLGV